MKSNAQELAAPLSLPEVARRLRSERINKVVAGYNERSVSIKRVGLVSLILIWTIYWARSAPKPGWTLVKEANTILPWVIGIFITSLGWAVYLRWRKGATEEWMEMAGSIANYIGIWLLLSKGWNISLSIITFMPLATMVIGARFSRKAFFAAMAGSVFLLGIAAPDEYWATRPAFIVFALILLVGLPLTVNRLLSALYEVSATAVHARDAQTRIIAMISHELRTPLNTICNATHVIDTTELSDDDQVLMASLATNANALLYRVNQVLDVAAIDNGRLHLSNEPMAIDLLPKAICDVLGGRAADKGVSLDIQVDPSLTEVLIGDAGRIEQVITNLVSNAIKFTPPSGAVTVKIDKEATNQSGVMVRFAVSDTGVGISAADKALIFQPFVQVSIGASRRHEGVGLGLHIVRGVSQQMDGSLSVEDRPDGGTVFTWRVTLPCAVNGQRPAAARRVLDVLEEHRNTIPSMCVLVADDNKPNRDIMRRLLDRAGHQVVQAPDGMAGLDLLRQRGTRIDAVLLDVHMPGMSGEDVLVQLQREGNKTPVIVVSADSDPDVVGTLLAKGAVAYLMKPVSPQRLLDVLASISAKSGELANHSPPIPATASEPTGLALMHELGDPESIRDYLNVLRTEIIDGLASIEHRLPTDSADSLASLHTLAGTLRNLGDTPAAETCAALGHALRAGNDYSLPLRQLRVRVKQSLASVDKQLAESRVDESAFP